MRTLRILEPIGEGVFGVVDLVEDKNTKEIFALKTVPKSAPNKRFNPVNVKSEVVAAKTVQHKNICKFLDTWEDDEGVYFLMEYLEGMTLINYMAAGDFEPFEEDYAFEIFRQLLGALEHIHSKGIAHRDLKLDNIMIDDHTGAIRIIDFGLCKTSDVKECRDEVGSLEYVAPEIIAREGKCYDGFLADIWSLGVCLYALLYGEFPFSPAKIHKAFETQVPLQLEIPPRQGISLEATDLLRKMLRTDPTKRISIKDIQLHPWFFAPAPSSSEA